MNRASNPPLIIPLDSPEFTLETVGGKGASLSNLVAAGLPVQPGFHITTAAYRHFVEANGLQQPMVEAAGAARPDDPASMERVSATIRQILEGASIPEEVTAAVRRAYANLDGEQTPVAVRSSATAEDLPKASFAGQHQTFLNVRGAEALLEAVKRCWTSLWTARAIAYRSRQRIAPESVSMAVVVQRMVEANAAGVLFTANPANGRRDQVVIDAAWGLGEAIVGGEVTPDHLVVDRKSGRVLSRETADKKLMTVCTEEGTAERPVPAELRRMPILDDSMAGELARLGTKIEAQFGPPQDIEWAVADGQIAILQSRPITVLPEPIGEVPSDWSVPDPTSLYFRTSYVELLPNPLSPLFATMVADPIVRTLNEVAITELGIHLEDADGFTTVNGYGYMFMRLQPWKWLGWLFKFPAFLPIVLQATRRLREEYRPRYEGSVERRKGESISEMTSTELLAGAQDLLYCGLQYYTGVQTVLPMVTLSEMLFSEFYNRLVRRAGDPPAQTFLLGFDSLPIQAEKSLYDLAVWCREHPGLVEVLINTPSDRSSDLLAADTPAADVEEGLWREWQYRFQAHLDRHGHMLYNLDFVNPVPADEPAPLFDTMKFYIRGEGVDPHARQRQAAKRREEATEAVNSRLDGLRLRTFQRLLRWAQSVAPERENALTSVGLGWPLLRQMLLELGRRLVIAGAIPRADDVFWLEKSEVEETAALLDGGSTRIDSLAAVVEARKMTWRGQKRASPPMSLPQIGLLKCIDMGRFMVARADEQHGNVVRGIAASAGRVTATARVLEGPEDFGQVRPGEVLVARITTPAWTPLFAMASAVVTDIGGPLSHGSIVAREYGIPAVMGTGNGTQRITNGQSVTVDGDAGTVSLLAAEGPLETAAVGQRPSFGRIGLSLALLVGAAVIAAIWRRRGRGDIVRPISFQYRPMKTGAARMPPGLKGNLERPQSKPWPLS